MSESEDDEYVYSDYEDEDEESQGDDMMAEDGGGGGKGKESKHTSSARETEGAQGGDSYSVRQVGEGGVGGRGLVSRNGVA